MQDKIIIKTTEVFDKWFGKLRDALLVVAIRDRLSRIKRGNFGDIKAVKNANGIYKIRTHLNKGYRIYYIREGNVVIRLLNGGNKDTQTADIEKAKRIKKLL